MRHLLLRDIVLSLSRPLDHPNQAGQTARLWASAILFARSPLGSIPQPEQGKKDDPHHH
jgi:hypothetical protein